MALSTQDLSTVFPLDLAPFVWQVLVGDPVGPADLVLLDPSLGQTLELLRSNISEVDLATVFPDQTFTATVQSAGLTSDAVEWEAELELEHGKPRRVTVSNAGEFATALESFWLEQYSLPIKWVLEGFASVAPARLLPVLAWRELELLVCGRPTVDLELLRRRTKYGRGLREDSQVVRFLWQTLERFSHAQRRQFVHFVWGRCRLPVSFPPHTYFRVNLRPAAADASGGRPGEEDLAMGDPGGILGILGTRGIDDEELMLARGVGDDDGEGGEGGDGGGGEDDGDGGEGGDGGGGGEDDGEGGGDGGDGEEDGEDGGDGEDAGEAARATEEAQIMRAMRAIQARRAMRARPRDDMTQAPQGPSIGAGEQDGALPTAHTCFFQLELPRYSSQAILQRQLLIAIYNTTFVAD